MAFTVSDFLYEIYAFFFHDQGFIGALIGFTLSTMMWAGLACVAFAAFLVVRKLCRIASCANRKLAELCDNVEHLKDSSGRILGAVGSIAKASPPMSSASYRRCDGSDRDAVSSQRGWGISWGHLLAIAPVVFGIAKGVLQFVSKSRLKAREGPTTFKIDPLSFPSEIPIAQPSDGRTPRRRCGYMKEVKPIPERTEAGNSREGNSHPPTQERHEAAKRGVGDAPRSDDGYARERYRPRPCPSPCPDPSEGGPTCTAFNHTINFSLAAPVPAPPTSPHPGDGGEELIAALLNTLMALSQRGFPPEGTLTPDAQEGGRAAMPVPLPVGDAPLCGGDAPLEREKGIVGARDNADAEGPFQPEAAVVPMQGDRAVLAHAGDVDVSCVHAHDGAERERGEGA